MKRYLFIFFSMILTACASSTSNTLSDEKPVIHWGYDGHEGPLYWGELSTDFTECSSGANQSPVNITHAIKSDLPPLDINYEAGGYEVLNNGHAIQVNYSPGSTITINDSVYELKQFHFHHPSENVIEGKSFALEAHLVHQNEEDKLAVVAIMFDEGESNHGLDNIWAQMPDHVDEHHALEMPASVSNLLPENKAYYRFSGSLTTPPCSEGVIWIVLKEPVSVSAEQVARFERAIHHFNNRPVQPVNARDILQ